MAEIPEGSTELMVHPGRCGPALRAAPTRLKESREAELAALVAPEVRRRDAAPRNRIGELRGVGRQLRVRDHSLTVAALFRALKITKYWELFFLVMRLYLGKLAKR